nr:hypothetical protein [Tanacetum cinerariifolium]
MAFLPSSNNNSTNGAVNIAQAVNITQAVNTAIDQPSSPQLVNEDLEQIHLDDLEEMDLKWTAPVETLASTTLVSCDGLGGYDWSDLAEEETVKILKSQNEQLTKDLKKLELMVLGYKTGLESVEERLKFFKTNKFVYLKDIKVLKVKFQMKNIAIKELRIKLELAQKEKDNIQLTVDKHENESKSLNKLIYCQIVENCKKRLGYENYNVVPPSYTGNFMPPKLDWSFTGLDEFANKPVVVNSKAESSQEKPKEVRKNTDAPIIME